MLTSFLFFQSLFIISKQEDTGELRTLTMCTGYDISKICEKSDPRKIYEFGNADLTTYKSIFKDVYVTKISYRILVKEKKILEVKDSKGNNLFYMKISLSKTLNDGFKDKVEFFRAEVAKIPTVLQGFFFLVKFTLLKMMFV